MKPLELSQYRVAKDIGVLPLRISQIIRGQRSVTADTALRFARYFGTSAEMWIGLQGDYDLRLTRYQRQKQIEQDIEPLAALEPVMA